MLNFIVHKKKLQLPVFIYLLALSPLNFFSSLGKVLQMSESSSDDNDDDKNAELGDPPSVDTMMNSHQELQTLSNNFIHAVEKHTYDLTTATEEQRMLRFQQLKTTTSAYMQASKEPARRRKLATSEYGHWREKWVASQKSDDATKKHCSQKTMCHLADFNISDITGLVRTHRAVDLVVYKQQKEGLKKQKQQLKQQYEQNIDKHILDAFGRASAQLQNVDEHKVGIKRKAIEDRGVEIQRGQCPTISILQDVPQGSWHKIALDQSKIFESIYSSLLSFGVMTSEDLKKDATCGGHLQQVNNLIKQAHEMSSSFLPIVIASPALPLSSPPILTSASGFEFLGIQPYMFKVPIRRCSTFIYVKPQPKSPDLSAKALFRKTQQPQHRVTATQIKKDPKDALSRLHSLVTFGMLKENMPEPSPEEAQPISFSIIAYNDLSKALDLLRKSMQGSLEDIDSAMELAQTVTQKFEF